MASTPALWKMLYFKQGWQVNSSRVRAFESWAQRIVLSKSILSTDELAGVVPHPFSTEHIAPLTESATVRLHWQYLYKEHLVLDRNWRTGLHELYDLPMDQGLIAGDSRAQGIYCLQFDHNYVVSGSRDKTIRIWDLENRICVGQLSGHTGSVLCLQYDGPTNTVISGSSDTTIITWDMLCGTATHIYTGHTEPVLNVRFDERHVVSCSKDKTIKVWSRDLTRLDAQACLRTLVGHRAAVNAVQFVGNRIVSASGDRSINIWDLETGDCLRSINGHERGIACIVFDGRYITSGSSDLSIRVFDSYTGALLETLTGHTDLVRTVQTDSRKIVSGSYDKTIKIWNRGGRLDDEKVIDLGRHNSRIFKLQFDEKRIISCSQDSCIFVWDFSTGVDDTFF
jgi:F-box and WD-40 domain protein 1/11